MEGLSSIARETLAGLMTLVRAGLRLLKFQLMLLLALVLLFEEWGWRPLAAMLAGLARFRPWARIEAWIAGLPPYGALVVFGMPATLLLPVKLAALYFLAHGEPVRATLVLIAAKLVGTALVARIFLLTKPTLMQLDWFARAYHRFIPWRDAITAKIRASWVWRYGRLLKSRILHETHAQWRRWMPKVQGVWLRVKTSTATWRSTMRDRAQHGWHRLREILNS